MWSPLRADIILNPLVMPGVSGRTIERPICMGQGGTTLLTHEVSILGYTSVRSKNMLESTSCIKATSKTGRIPTQNRMEKFATFVVATFSWIIPKFAKPYAFFRMQKLACLAIPE